MQAGKPIGVGIIGASPDRGWAMRAHIPALRALPGFRIAALSTSRAESAQAAGRAFGVERVFADHRELVRETTVDLVVVTVKVPAHVELVDCALSAGKHVLCEWPLAVTAAEAERLLQRARAKGVRQFIGLQARASPEINYVKDLVAEGYVGRVLSCSVIGSGRAWGAETDRFGVYLRDPAHGATMLSVPAGHFLDAFCYCMGEFAELSSRMTLQRKEFVVTETGETLRARTPDQIVIQGALESGAEVSIHYRGGLSRATNFHWEINGTEGDLVVTAATGHVQLEDLRLQGARAKEPLADLPVPERYCLWPGLPEGQAFNVGQLYVQIAEDLRTGRTSCAGFEVATRRHHLLESIMHAADTGTRQRVQADR